MNDLMRTLVAELMCKAAFLKKVSLDNAITPMNASTTIGSTAAPGEEMGAGRLVGQIALGATGPGKLLNAYYGVKDISSGVGSIANTAQSMLPTAAAVRGE
jgi:hypothetical protein